MSESGNVAANYSTTVTVPVSGPHWQAGRRTPGPGLRLGVYGRQSAMNVTVSDCTGPSRAQCGIFASQASAPLHRLVTVTLRLASCQ